LFVFLPAGGNCVDIQSRRGVDGQTVRTDEYGQVEAESYVYNKLIVIYRNDRVEIYLKIKYFGLT
jgi:hypothetical protein